MPSDSLTQDNALHAVKVLIFDPISEDRKRLLQSMQALGFKDIETVKDQAQFRAALEFTSFDLVFAECRQDAGGELGHCAHELSRIIKALRFGDIGPNPYLVFINTAWILNDGVVKTIIDSGTDDLLARPFSTESIRHRIDKQVKMRKKFIVTSDYVGPDRRKNRHSPSQACTLAVPNSLKAKVIEDHKTLLNIPTAIEAAKATVTIEKMRRQPLRIGVLANLLGDASWDKSLKLGGKEKMEHNLRDLSAVTEDLDKRIGQTGYSHLEHLSTALKELSQTMVKKFQSDIILDTDDVEKLKKYSTNLQIAFNPRETESSVNASITSILCRREMEFI